MKLFLSLIFPIIFAACTRPATFGEQYLGAPYVRDPLGEGVAPDADPLIRFDAFDCTTFVETVLADSDVEKLNKIRYKDGNIDFKSRNHFIESEWIPNNSNLVTNASAKYGKTAIRTVKINRAEWMKRVHHMSISEPVKTVDLEYVPYENLSNIKIEKPIIVLFVHGRPRFADKIGTDLAVHHMGFLLPNGMFRHASISAKKVVDVNFDEYVAKRKKMPNNIGIVLLEIKDGTR